MYNTLQKNFEIPNMSDLFYSQKFILIKKICKENEIYMAKTGGSFYFYINGQEYRVSDHTIKESNEGAINKKTGKRMRKNYHKDIEDQNTIYIHVSKGIIDDGLILIIYKDLLNGIKYDYYGKRIYS